MQEVNFDEVLEKILEKDPRYHRDAYHFIREALDFTQHSVSKENHGQVRHVSGQELLVGIREFALQQFGPMAKTVLNEWGIQKSDDFGELVFNMIENGLLAKNQKDSRDHFRNGYDFTDAFTKPFWPKSKAKPSTKTRV
jgi:uncharacterized repeat protein (TIGR04138 family)